MKTVPKYDNHELLQNIEHQPPMVKVEPIEALSEAIMITGSKPAELESGPPAKSQSFPQWLSRHMTPNTIHLILQLLFIAIFCGLLVLYVQYSRARKATDREICKQDAQTLYEENLAHCEVKAATSVRGGALGLNWLEMGVAIVVAAAWQYATWFAQGWLIVRISFVKKN